MIGAPLERRCFLFLQGPSSSLFNKIASQLRKAGHECRRVNFNAGDWLFWSGGNATNYRGKFSNWSSYIPLYFATLGVTDLILLGEERPYHRIAIEHAKTLGIAVTVVEMGYLRPDWVTVEKDGMSSNSRFPTDPAEIHRLSALLDDPDFDEKYHHFFSVEALLDIAYNLTSVLFFFLYPGHRRHGIFHPFMEYAGWVKRLLSARQRERNAIKVINKVTRENLAYFIYPLQLETDYQLRAHSPFRSQAEAIDHVLSSFAAHAGSDVRLLVKVHPLDNGLVSWPRTVRRRAIALGVESKIEIVDGGDLGKLIESCRGIVTVNSTTALHGIRRGIPAKVLGSAIYDIPGLTHQGSLASFWTSPEKGDKTLITDFYRLLAGSIQVRGNFYSQEGTAAAAAGIATRLLNKTVNWPACDHRPPRARPSKMPQR